MRNDSESGVTNKWGVYIADPDAKNFFSGNLQIGSTTPTVGAEKLQVTGAASISGALTVATGGSAGKATCWKADGKTIGYCSSVVDSSGGCTCN